MRNGYRGIKIRLPKMPYSERMKAYGYETTEDFKARLRVMNGRPEIVSNAPRQKATMRRRNEHSNT